MFEDRYSYHKMSSYNTQKIFRINKETGATERQVFNGALSSEMKKQGWKIEVTKGKRLFKKRRQK